MAQRHDGDAVAKTIAIEEKLAEWERQRGIHAPHRVAVYVSVPITTGLRFIEWYRATGHRLDPNSDEYLTARQAHVVLPNVQHAASFIEILRWRAGGFIIDPTALDVPGWTQDEYNLFWSRIIERHVRRVVFLNGWHYSNGCTIEFAAAQRLGLECVDESFEPLSRERALDLIGGALDERRQFGLDVTQLQRIFDSMRTARAVAQSSERLLFKDQGLNALARTANVAQFVSFEPGHSLKQRFCRVHGFTENHRFADAAEAVRALMEKSPEGLVNIRTFDPRKPEGNPFERKLSSVDQVLQRLRALGGDRGLHTIVNETINESDGGVSGVAYRGVLEFAPDANPRCVDDDAIETTSLSMTAGLRVLATVYGFEPDLGGREGARVEFSVHPAPRGWMRDHTVVWQIEQRPAQHLRAPLQTSTRFSRMLGDKAYGLTVAAAAGLRVPRGTVFTRRLAPFVIGEPTGTGKSWTRTCPAEKTPGYYPTVRGWRDPYALLQEWSHPLVTTPVPELSSVLVQEAVAARYSGRAVYRREAPTEIAGTPGEGDAFMLGGAPAGSIPEAIVAPVRDAHAEACDLLGPVDIEWVHDGALVWILQINRARLPKAEARIPDDWEQFQYTKGSIEGFRQLVAALTGTRKGIVVVGNVSPLSHVGEIAELAGVPVRFVQRES